MEEFKLYATLGFEHIAGFEDFGGVWGYLKSIPQQDHFLFIATLCAIYRPKQWKALLILVTAFTVGHSVTLALAALKIVAVPQDITEFFIPVTIFLTAALNMWQGQYQTGQKLWGHYLMALAIGLVHGMGFSNYFSSLLGMEESIVTPLFSFNIGLEGGQLLIVLFIMGLSYLIIDILKAPFKYWNWFISGGAMFISSQMIWERKFW